MENENLQKGGDFISYIAHELRAPLASMRWNTEMLMDGTLGTITDDQKKILTQIYDGNKRIADTINKLLDIVHTENGKYVIEKNNIDIIPILNEMIVKYNNDMQIRGVGLTVNFPLSYMITLDRKSFERIVDTLIANATIYNKQGGKIMIDLHVGNELVLVVKDTGVGIKDDEKEKIGRDMFRGSNVKGNTNGSGLSLVLVQKILSLTGGALTFQSTENEGSTFTLTLPITE